MIRKIRFYKALLVEITETLCSICLYLETDGRYTHNDQARLMRSHFNMLKGFSEDLRGKDMKMNDAYVKMYRDRG